MTGFMFQYSLCPAKEYRTVQELMLEICCWDKGGNANQGDRHIPWECGMEWNGCSSWIYQHSRKRHPQAGKSREILLDWINKTPGAHSQG